VTASASGRSSRPPSKSPRIRNTIHSRSPTKEERRAHRGEDIIANANIVKSIQEFKELEPLTQSKMTRAKEEEVKQISFLSQGKQEKGSSWPTKK